MKFLDALKSIWSKIRLDKDDDEDTSAPSPKTGQAQSETPSNVDSQHGINTKADRQNMALASGAGALASGSVGSGLLSAGVAAAGVGASIYNTYQTNQANKDIAEQNLDFQRDVLNYNKGLQQTIFDREDNSYQRTVADMRAAGLSPLAMQGTNGAGEAVAVEAPQNGYQQQPYDINGIIQNLMSAATYIRDSRLQNEQIRSLQLDNDYKAQTNSINAKMLANSYLSNKMDLSDREQKRLYNLFYGLNDSMSEKERLFHLLFGKRGLGDSYSVNAPDKSTDFTNQLMDSLGLDKSDKNAFQRLLDLLSEKSQRFSNMWSDFTTNSNGHHR